MTTKITGVDILIHVNVGTELSPDWKAVGGQRGASLSESRETKDVTSKLSPGGYKQNEYGLAEWSISCDGVYVESEQAYAHLVAAMRNKNKVMARWLEGGAGVFEGTALVTSRDLDGPYDGEATYSMELQGDGQPTSTNNYSNNLSALTGIQKEGAAALVFVPVFAAGTYTYITNVVTASTWIKLTPTAAAGTITINGFPVTSGVQSGEIAIGAAGSLTSVLVKVQQNGMLAREYKITVARAAA